MTKLERRVFVICPVRGIDDREKQFLDSYVAGLESNGIGVHYPPRDTKQDDENGLNICSQNRKAIEDSDEVHIYYNPNSEGSKFDLGMAFMSKKPIKLINLKDVQRTPHKSFQNVLLELNTRYRARVC